jgi:diacylglycerol O-acyltransferase / wax synthase
VTPDSGLIDGFEALVTNVRGVQIPLYFSGARAVFMSGTGPVADGMGLFHHGIGSYNGMMPICFSVDRSMMPDPQFYERCLDEAVAELLERAKRLAPSLKSRSRRRTKTA